MYKGYITDVEGIEVGHAENYEALTGCTVVLAKEGASAGIDVRGSGPGTRETDIFDTKKMIEKIHGIVLTGGSAFGLDSAGGVMSYLEENKIGFDVGLTRVPIVPAAVIFDLAVGDYKIRPDFEMGYKAAKNASSEENRQGNIGCGLGASIGKILGPNYIMKSGLGSASIRLGELVIGAIVAVNAFGDIYDFENNKQIAGVYDYKNKSLINTMDVMMEKQKIDFNPTNTTIGVIATNAKLSKGQANKVAEMGHNGFAKVISPIHTMNDGDTIFTMATNKVESDVTLVGSLGAEVMAKAIINAVKSTESIGGIASYSSIKFK